MADILPASAACPTFDSQPLVVMHVFVRDLAGHSIQLGKFATLHIYKDTKLTLISQRPTRLNRFSSPSPTALASLPASNDSFSAGNSS